MAKSDYKFIHTLRVRWKECDIQGIAFYGSYLDYIEVGEAEYFRNLGIYTLQKEPRKKFDLAAVKLTLEFKSSAKVDELIDLHMKIANMGRSSMVESTEIYRSGTDELLVTGERISVNFDSSKAKSRRIPDDIRTIIERFENTGVTPTKHLN